MKRTICILLCLLACLAASGQAGYGVRTVVIDPGHGGKDPGAISKDRKTYEKSLTLDIATKLATKIQNAYPDVKVVMTRNSDTFPELEERARIANDANADLFISLHINAAASTSASGFSVHVLGQSSNKDRDLYAFNMDICKRENSVIMLEEDYSEKYQGFDPSDPASYIFMQLMQNSNLERSIQFAEDVDRSLRGGPVSRDRGVSQNPFLVLWMTSMPAVLVELGFISNSSDLAALRDSKNRENIAGRLFNAFKTYKESLEPQQPQPQPQQEQPAPVKEVQTGSTLYGIQVIASSKVLDRSNPVFQGYEPKMVTVGKLNKYAIAVSPEISEVKKVFPEIKKKNPDCFIVVIEDDSKIFAY